jgi:hypothetical protein
MFVVSVASAAMAVACGTQGDAERVQEDANRAQVHGTLNQVMRGVLFPNSNVVFTLQGVDPTTFKPEADPATSPNPLTGAYPGWQALENAGLALAESANLLTIPGRVCSNGKPAPVQNDDWIKFVADLRAAGMVTYKAGQARTEDAVLDAADKVVTACSNCHDVYREKTPEQGGEAARCTK